MCRELLSWEIERPRSARPAPPMPAATSQRSSLSTNPVVDTSLTQLQRFMFVDDVVTLNTLYTQALRLGIERSRGTADTDGAFFAHVLERLAALRASPGGKAAELKTKSPMLLTNAKTLRALLTHLMNKPGVTLQTLVRLVS